MTTSHSAPRRTDPRRTAPRRTAVQAVRAARVLLRGLTTLALVVLVAGVAVGGWAVGSGAWQAHPVLSGSMEPGLPVGSVALVRRVPTVDLAVGDVIVFREPGNPTHLITHRISRIVDRPGGPVYRTKGDANAHPDPWRVTLRGATSYRLAGEVPYLGYATVWLRQPAARTWLFGLAGLVAGYAVVQLFLPDHWWRRRRAGAPASSR